MKKVLFFLALLFSQLANAQNITITINGSPDSLVKINYPVNGINYIYWQNGKTYKLDASHSVKFPNTLKTAGVIYVTNNGTNKKIFIEPQKSIDINIISNDKGNILHINGPNARGIERYDAIKHPFYQQKARTYSQKDTLMASINKGISADISSELHPFDSLLNTKKITEDFYRFAKTSIVYYYASVRAASIFEEYFKTLYDHKHPYYKPTFAKDLADGWPDVFKAYPVNNLAAINSDEFFYYAKDYATWYKLYYLTKKNGNFSGAIAELNTLPKFYESFEINFTGQVREYMLARFIFDEAMEKQYQPQLIDLYHRFTASYPKSSFTVYLTPLIDEINAFQKKTAQDLQANEKILQGDSLNNFDQLKALFKNKTAYIDIWATWCGPCKEEFAYGPDLRKFLAGKNVEMVYLSIDNDKADKQWKDMIKFYGLAGNHIRANDSLRNDLMKKFSAKQGFGIPRYMIIKNGALVETDALQPSDKQKLYDQLIKYL